MTANENRNKNTAEKHGIDCDPEFLQLWEAHSHNLLAFITNRFGDPEIASDVLGDLYTKARKLWLESLPDNPVAWLFAAAKNLSIDWIRRSKAKKRSVVQISDSYEPGDERQDQHSRLAIEQKTEKQVALSECHKKLAETSPLLFMTFMLVVVGRIDTKEVADDYQVTRNRVHRRVHDARNMLKECIGKKMGLT